MDRVRRQRVAIATDLEAWENYEMIHILKSLYNKEALKVAARRISHQKREQIRQWVAQLDAQTLNHSQYCSVKHFRSGVWFGEKVKG